MKIYLTFRLLFLRLRTSTFIWFAVSAISRVLGRTATFARTGSANSIANEFSPPKKDGLRRLVIVAAVSVLAACATPERTQSTPSATNAGNTGGVSPANNSSAAASQIIEAQRGTPEYDEFRRFYDEYFAAWNAAFPANLDAPARFYSQEPGLVAYDPSPTRNGAIVDGPIGWTGLREHFGRNIFPTLQSFSFNFAPEDNLRVWRRGDVAWASFVWRVAARGEDERAQQTDGRQSNIFERRNGQWVIVHEHASVPVPEGVTEVRAQRVVPLGSPLVNADAEFQRMINDYSAQWHAQNGNPPDWDDITSYYAPDSDIVLIDASPFQPNIGFAAFRENAQKTFFDQVTFWTFAANPDAQAVRRGDVMWTTFTARVSGRLKNGQNVEQDLRQSNVWERRDGKWLIVHEHGSVPLAK